MVSTKFTAVGVTMPIIPPTVPVAIVGRAMGAVAAALSGGIALFAAKQQTCKSQWLPEAWHLHELLCESFSDMM